MCLAVGLPKAEGAVPSRLGEYAGLYFRVYGRVRVPRKESSTHGWSPHWVWGEGGPAQRLVRWGERGGEPAHDTTVTMSPFWNCPTHWHHDFAGRRLAKGCGGDLAKGGSFGNLGWVLQHPLPLPRGIFGSIDEWMRGRRTDFSVFPPSMKPCFVPFLQSALKAKYESSLWVWLYVTDSDSARREYLMCQEHAVRFVSSKQARSRVAGSPGG